MLKVDSLAEIKFYYTLNRNGSKTTIATIETSASTGQKKLFSGSVTNHVKDPFNKIEGRKRAFQKAIKKADFLTKNERTTIWDAYKEKIKLT